MNIFFILLIALSMAMDAFAVSLGAGTTLQNVGYRPVFRLSFHFGLFQFAMPVIGWYLGSSIEPVIAPYDHWIAFGLLTFVGVRMLLSGIDGNNSSLKTDPSRGMTLVLLSIATSIDALAIGLTLAIMKVDIWYPAVVIGVVTGLLSLIGLRMGNTLGEKFGKRMEIAGGIVLILIGLRIVASHLRV